MQSELINTSDKNSSDPAGLSPKACVVEFLILLEGQKK
jgi:hypothetical protein